MCNNPTARSGAEEVHGGVRVVPADGGESDAGRFQNAAGRGGLHHLPPESRLHRHVHQVGCNFYTKNQFH